MAESTFTTSIQPDIEEFVVAVLEGIKAANETSSDYRLLVKAGAVRKLAEEYDKLKWIEIY